MKKEKCEHLWDCEEFNPHCHICGLLMRDDIKEEKHLDWEEELEKKDKDNFPSSYNWSREKWIDFIRNLLEKERERIGKELWKWFYSKDKELIEEAITRITGVEDIKSKLK